MNTDKKQKRPAVPLEQSSASSSDPLVLLIRVIRGPSSSLFFSSLCLCASVVNLFFFCGESPRFFSPRKAGHGQRASETGPATAPPWGGLSSATDDGA